MPKKKKVGLVVDFYKKKAVKLANEVECWFKKKNCSTFIKSIPDLTESILKKLDFIIAFGGDGTVLRTANAVAPYNIPMARVNFGTTGYLCNIKPKEVFQALEKILNGQYRVETQARIKAKIVKGKKFIDVFDAFNEITVGSGSEKKTAWLQIAVVDHNTGYERERVVRTTGDGLIIATKGGSTGYALSAGGPALLEDGYVVVSSNGRFEGGFLPSHAPSFVIYGYVWFEITVLRGGPNLPCVMADSDDQRKRKLEEGERVIISKSILKNLFIEF